MLSDVLTDLRAALRGIRKQPGFAIVVVATLALGIGANTAMFALVHATLLRPLPYEAPDRLVLARRTIASRALMWNSAPDYYDYKADATSFASLAASMPRAVRIGIAAGGRPERADLMVVSTDLFSTLGIRPIAGRLFGASDGTSDAAQVALVSSSFAARRYGDAQAALGQPLSQAGGGTDGLVATIVGVMPMGCRFLDDADVWLPMRRGENDGPTTRQFHNWVLVGRLRPGVTLDAARSQVNVIAARLQQTYPGTNKEKGLRLDPLQGALFEAQTPRLMLLMGAVALVLLIACANVAGLLLARGTTRRPELAVRAALGASRGRIFAQLLTESLLLAFVSGVLGIALAFWLQRLLPMATGLADSGVIVRGLDSTVLIFAAAISLATGILFGTVPALRASSRSVASSLGSGPRLAGTAGGTRLRSLLVVAQVAVSLVLLIGAGLLVRSFARLVTTDLGFDPERLLTAQIEAPYEDQAQRLQFYSGLAADVALIPGVTSVAFTTHVPVRDPWGDPPVWAEGRRPVDSTGERTANLRVVSPGYFRTMGMPLAAGRDLDESDTADTRPVGVITSGAAETFFPEGNPIGKRIMISTADEPIPVEIVGIVADAHLNSVAGGPYPAIYVSITQRTPERLNLMVRTGLPPASLTNTVRAKVTARDSNVPVDDVTAMEAVLGDSLLQPRVTTVTLGLFSALALVLALLGLYGVLAYYVVQRRHEIGVRMALGADTRQVLMLVVARSAVLVGPGLLIGVIAAAAGVRLMENQLYDVTPFDPATYLGVTALMAVVALGASAWPAWRAAHIDAARVLRSE